jgi:hypothetical protein
MELILKGVSRLDESEHRPEKRALAS